MKIYYLVFLLLSFNANAEEWTVDAKKLSNSYGAFIGYMAGVFSAVEECKKNRKRIK